MIDLLKTQKRLRRTKKWLVFVFFMIGLAAIGSWYTLLFIIGILVGLAICTVIVLEQINELKIMICGVKQWVSTRKN